MLELEAVTKRFGGLTAVKDVSLRAAPGEILGIIGPNGAGKTTLFNVISGFYAPNAGTVRLDGRDISGLAPHHVCALGLTRTFQLVKPFGNLSVLADAMIRKLTRVHAVSAARDAAMVSGLHPVATTTASVPHTSRLAHFAFIRESPGISRSAARRG